MQARLLLPAVAAALALLTAATPAPDGWIPLFNGRDLEGWEVKGGTARYEVRDGQIVGTTVDGSPNTFLCRGPFGDFDLRLEVKCDLPLNSGIQIRSHAYERDTPQPSNPKRLRKQGEVYGYQCEITTRAQGTAGNFWDEGRHTKWWDNLTNRPGALQAFKDGAWNEYRIVAQGDRIRSWVNGVPCADFRDGTDRTGFIGLQVHGIKKGEGPHQVRWRNVRLRELKPDDRVD